MHSFFSELITPPRCSQRKSATKGGDTNSSHSFRYSML
uniref:Uncharacterized protein n=1 Tax=Arundo donax TaxID=35708 RepID=A0A0A8XUF2_ARUDO